MAYSVITSGQVDAESPYDTTLANQMAYNFEGAFAADAGAPTIVFNAFAAATKAKIYSPPIVDNTFHGIFGPASYASAAAAAAAAASLWYFVSTGAAQGARGTWYYPANDALSASQYTAVVVRNTTGASINVVVSVDVVCYSDDTRQVRLLQDGAVIETKNITTSAGQEVVSFTAVTVADGDTVCFAVQGAITGGSSDDSIIVRDIYGTIA